MRFKLTHIIKETGETNYFEDTSFLGAALLFLGYLDVVYNPSREHLGETFKALAELTDSYDPKDEAGYFDFSCPEEAFTLIIEEIKE